MSSLRLIVNTLRPRRNEQHFADDIFKRIFVNENVWISVKISLKFVSEGPINNIPALVQIMAWRRSGDKPLSEPMMVKLPTHICVTRPQWVKSEIAQVWHISWSHLYQENKTSHRDCYFLFSNSPDRSFIAAHIDAPKTILNIEPVRWVRWFDEFKAPTYIFNHIIIRNLCDKF